MRKLTDKEINDLLLLRELFNDLYAERGFSSGAYKVKLAIANMLGARQTDEDDDVEQWVLAMAEMMGRARKHS